MNVLSECDTYYFQINYLYFLEKAVAVRIGRNFKLDTIKSVYNAGFSHILDF